MEVDSAVGNQSLFHVPQNRWTLENPKTRNLSGRWRKQKGIDLTFWILGQNQTGYLHVSSISITQATHLASEEERWVSPLLRVAQLGHPWTFGSKFKAQGTQMDWLIFDDLWVPRLCKLEKYLSMPSGHASRLNHCRGSGMRYRRSSHTLGAKKSGLPYSLAKPVYQGEKWLTSPDFGFPMDGKCWGDTFQFIPGKSEGAGRLSLGHVRPDGGLDGPHLGMPVWFSDAWLMKVDGWWMLMVDKWNEQIGIVLPLASLQIETTWILTPLIRLLPLFSGILAHNVKDVMEATAQIFLGALTAWTSTPGLWNHHHIIETPQVGKKKWKSDKTRDDLRHGMLQAPSAPPRDSDPPAPVTWLILAPCLMDGYGWIIIPQMLDELG